MATTSFSRPATPVEVEVTSAPAPLAAATPAAPASAEKAIVTEGFYDQQIDGEITQRDIRLPRINLVQKTGDLGEHFSAGSFVYNKEVLLSSGKEDEPLRLTVLRLRKQYQEKTKFGSDEQPRVFNTLAEVRNAGGTIEYEVAQEDPKIKLFEELAHLKVLLEWPEGVDNDHAIYEFGGKSYALCAWSMKGSAYKSAGKAVITAAQTHLKAGLHLGSWFLTSINKKWNGNSWHNPVLRTAGKNSPEFAAFAQELI
jgi:hypothetical protein